jgi:hypothetical protein
MTEKRVHVLNEMDIKETPDHRPIYFSISFYTATGELVFLPRAQCVGLRFNMNKNRFRGVQAFDKSGTRHGHVYPVCIDNIREFNNKRVVI